MQNPVRACDKCKVKSKITTIILDKDSIIYLCELCSFGIDDELDYQERKLWN